MTVANDRPARRHMPAPPKICCRQRFQPIAAPYRAAGLLSRLWTHPIPGGRAESTGLAGLEAGDLVALDRELPVGPHRTVGRVRVVDDQRASVVRLRLDLHPAVGGEDLTVHPFG